MVPVSAGTPAAHCILSRPMIHATEAAPTDALWLPAATISRRYQPEFVGAKVNYTSARKRHAASTSKWGTFELFPAKVYPTRVRKPCRTFLVSSV